MQLPPPRESRRLTPLAVVLALACLTSACVQPKKPGVGISPLNADIVFGVKAVESDVAPPNFIPTVSPSDAGITGGTDVLPPAIFTPPPPINFPRPPIVNTGPAVNDCPPAALTAFPEEEAPFTVPDKSRLPKEGVYRWKRSGSYTANDSKVSVSGFEQRVVRNVKLVSDAPRPSTSSANPGESLPRLQYTFEVVQPVIGTTAVAVLGFFVDTNAPGTVDQNSPVSGDRATAGTAERGLVLRTITYLDAKGAALPGGFSANPGLLLAPIPIRQGESFNSVAVDTKSEQAIRFAGQTVRRQRVDACGEILDGWLVSGDQTISDRSGSGKTRKYSMIIAPQFGALMVNEGTDGATLEGGTATLDFTIGQKNPSPAAAG
jgi:hypothetical protein